MFLEISSEQKSQKKGGVERNTSFSQVFKEDLLAQKISVHYSTKQYHPSK